MVRLSYELSVVFDHNPIIEIAMAMSFLKSGCARRSYLAAVQQLGLLWAF